MDTVVNGLAPLLLDLLYMHLYHAFPLPSEDQDPVVSPLPTGS